MPNVALLLVHPITACRAILAAQAERADAAAIAAGLTVEVLPGGVRRYHDPRLTVRRAGIVTRAADEPAEVDKTRRNVA